MIKNIISDGRPLKISETEKPPRSGEKNPEIMLRGGQAWLRGGAPELKSLRGGALRGGPQTLEDTLSTGTLLYNYRTSHDFVEAI